MRGAVRRGARRRPALRAIRGHLAREQLFTLLVVRRSRVAATALVLSAVLLSTACATPTVSISEEDRCTRFGGVWVRQIQSCRVPGGGGM